MKCSFRAAAAVASFGIAAFLTQGLSPSFAQQAPAGAAAPGAQRGGRGGGLNADPRAQSRTYKFTDTNEDMQYCVFVSSKVSKDKKNPLIISLHGLGVGPGFMCRGKAVDLAEEGGYILAAPMGYNTGGWFGSPVLNTGGRGGRGAPAGAGAAPAAPPANLAELSEKDVMNVLDMMRKEFTVDENRTYLMGHSMGGAGALFLGSKHAKQWTAIAPMAPAAFSMAPTRATYLQALKDAKVPVFLTTGDADELVPVAGTRTWMETMKELQMSHEYKEYPGVTHGPIIEAAMPDIFAFFAKHTKGR
jgi:poly(3-hydroxybutyrate) depolymerase